MVGPHKLYVALLKKLRTHGTEQGHLANNYMSVSLLLGKTYSQKS